MNKSNLFRHLAVTGFACLLSALCSDVTDDGATLPDGKYPMTFTASVDGLTVSRATTDADGTTSWQVGDFVAISMDGDDSHKQYKISDAGIGAMAPNDEAHPLYWSKRTETLAAWHPVSCTIGTNTSGSEVNITDQHSGFGTLENILHAPAKDYTYSSSNPVAFAFRHALAKVKVTLKNGDGITADDLSNATVTFTGYTAGSLGYNGMTGSGSNGDITPKTETPNGSAATYTALVIPQQMQGKKFIKVTIGAGGAARDYFYTPTGNDDANLEAGKQYNYTITVKKTGLEVTMTSNGVSWGDNREANGSFDETIGFLITAPAGVSITAADGSGGTLNDNHNGSYTLYDDNKITVTVNGQSNKTLNDLSATGIYDKAIGNYSSDSNTYTYTYTLKSDIVIISPVFADESTLAVGDYYYSDGTWSACFWKEKNCVGIVFKLGAGADDDASKYDDKLTNSIIHGYVAALNDAAQGNKQAWSTEKVTTGVGTSKEYFDGYTNTETIKKITDYQSKYPAVSSCIDNNGTTAPGASSGWYMPSGAQIRALYDARNEVDSKFTTAGGAPLARADYWTNSEVAGKAATAVYHFSTYYVGLWDDHEKTDSGKDLSRAILTF